MSDWDIVKEYVLSKNYIPKYTDLDGLITVILLSWDGQNEEDGEETELKTFLNETVGEDLRSYDYE